MKKYKYVIASSHSEAGICNRIKNLISILRLSKKLKRKLLLLWMPPNLMGGAAFSELFSTKIARISEGKVNRLIKAGKVKICSSYEDCLEGNYKYLLFPSWRFILLPGDIPEGFARVFPENNGKVIDMEYERIPLRLRNDFLIYVKQMSPTKSIKDKIDKFVKKHNNFKNVVGLHVRRRDFLLATCGRGRVSTDEKFFKRMREIMKEKPETKFFLATDCPITKEKFIKEFPNRIIDFPHKNWDKSTKEATISGLIDMLLLSKTNYILGSFLSSFTEIAWWFGGAKSKVEIIGDEKTKKEVIKTTTKKKPSKVYSKIFRPIKQIFKFFTLHSPLFRFFWNKYLDYQTKKINKQHLYKLFFIS